MKKSLLALAVLSAIAGSAAAQTSITMYGIADVGFVRESGNPAGPVSKLTSGVTAGSRIGFRGVEDLGGGMAALFTMETGILMDTGGNAQQAVGPKSRAGLPPNPSGNAFARQTFVGLKSNAGTLTMGRQYNPYFYSLYAVDPFGTGHEGNSGNVMPLTASNGRSDNSIMYVSPVVSGFKGELLYGFGEQAGSTHAKSAMSAAVSYANGPLLIRLATFRGNTDTIADPAATPPRAATSVPVTRNNILGAVYDFKVVKLSAAYATIKGPRPFLYAQDIVGFYGPTPYTAFNPPKSTDVRDFLLGATIPAGPGNILASYIRHKDRTATNQNATQMAIGYEYYLSKRTVWYTDYSRIRNDNGAGFTVGNAGDVTAGSGDRGFATGLRHTF